MSLRIIFIFSFLFCLTTQAISQDYVIESWDYDVGSDIDTLLGTPGAGWLDSWDLENTGFDDHATGTVADTGLAYDDMNYATENKGNHMQVDVPGGWVAARWNRFLDKTWPDQAGTSYWVSLIFQAKITPVGNTYYIMKLYYETETDTSERIAIGKAGGDVYFSAGSGWPDAGSPDRSAIACETYPTWLVVRIDASGDTLNDRTYMWIDPDPSVEPDTTIADVKRNTNLGTQGFNRVALECGGEMENTLHWDEFRLGTSYEAVAGAITSIGREQVLTPDRLQLSQNYPNPFNPQTHITFNIEKSGDIRLAVFDMTGKEIAVVAEGYYNKGSHTVEFSANDLASGIYFYKLYSADGSITKKMTIIK